MQMTHYNARKGLGFRLVGPKALGPILQIKPNVSISLTPAAP